ncbi:hypothetical protein AVEN_224629-1 [Araneus ventricosus]|uniref:Uncharacterized protein n=1 Tax=Araneus ventricosus TaxID=182803 RepID=A0A4Y2MBC5_ARAVE|nr:hypothetical protein AVEN_224629-1 [Araneus ventricosus]
MSFRAVYGSQISNIHPDRRTAYVRLVFRLDGPQGAVLLTRWEQALPRFESFPDQVVSRNESKGFVVDIGTKSETPPLQEMPSS